MIPELLIESYHSSLRSVASLQESLANTSRIVDRVAAVIESRHSTLEASIQAYTERRDKALAALVAIFSLLALPPALLLAYFGTNSTNVDARFSIFDLRHYGIAYLVVWLPFIALAVAALVLRWRIQPRTRGWARRTDTSTASDPRFVRSSTLRLCGWWCGGGPGRGGRRCRVAGRRRPRRRRRPPA
jgi:hypothetical protein